jgi:hypothetical protein
VFDPALRAYNDINRLYAHLAEGYRRVFLNAG